MVLTFVGTPPVACLFFLTHAFVVLVLARSLSLKGDGYCDSGNNNEICGEVWKFSKDLICRAHCDRLCSTLHGS